MLSSIFLVIITLVKGFKIDENPLFLLIESLINVFVLTDFLCRIKLMGAKRFFEGGYWNVFDAIVVIGCIILFIIITLSKTSQVLIFEEVSEEILLVSWGVF